MKKKNKKFAKLKKVLAGFMALVLVVGLTILGTLAYLSVNSDPVTNTFTPTKSIKLTLKEPAWTAAVEEAAGKFKPGEHFDKNPMLTNTSGVADSPEWVMLRVDYLMKKSPNNTYSSVQKTELEKLLTINGLDSTNWIKVNNGWLNETNTTAMNGIKCEFYIYKKTLASDTTVTDTSLPSATDGTNASQTIPLFTGVTIQNQATITANKEANGFDINSLPSYRIELLGAAIKNEASNGVDANSDVYINGGTLTLSSTTSAGDLNVIEKNIINELVSLLISHNPTTS